MIRREDPPARRDEPIYRRDDSSSRGDVNRPRRDDIRADSPTNRDRIDAGRPNPRDDIRADGPVFRDRNNTPDRTTDRAPRTDDKNGRTDRNDRPNPAPDRDKNTTSPDRDRNPNIPERDRATNQDRDRRPTDSGSNEGGGIFNRSRPGREGTRPDRDYRGEPYSGAGRRDNNRDQVINRGSDARNRGRGEDVRPDRDRTYDIFSRSREGRQYKNGIVLRSGGYISDRGLRNYFRRDYCYYPYYYPRYEPAVVYYSPYSYYYGVCPPYIYRRHAYYYPPSVTYIDFPIYIGVDFRNWRGYDDNDYYLERRDTYSDPARLPDRELEDAVRDLREAFRFNNINLLTNLTDPSVRIAVFLRGKYEYSLNASDYLDMTRDMFASTETITFDIERIRRRSADVWVVSGKQIYLNHDNARRTVYLSFVMERVHGRWTVTQVGTAPDRIEEPKS